MTTDLLQLPGQRIFFMSDGFGLEPRVYAGSKGSSVFADVAVFRSGTFRDSMGSQNTWEDLHIKQMMDNFTHLRDKNIIETVPARDGHPGFIVNGMRGKGEVVGWHRDVKTRVLKSPVDSKEYTYLLADYEITQQYALEKINNGTWRNRSAEVGGYVTNAESEFWPVYMGFAFVDFPAVEGLNFSSPHGKFYAFFGGTSRESSVTDNANTGAGQGAPQLPFPVLPTQAGANHTVPQPQQPPAQPAPFVFSVNGQNVTDPNAVQAYVRQLESFVTETRQSGRKAFVASLVSENKLAAPQKDDMEKFALSLNDEQYTAWSAQWSAAQPLALLANHGGGASNLSNSAQPSPQDQAVADAEAIVKMHETGGVMKPEQLKQTASYKVLVTAGKRQA